MAHDLDHEAEGRNGMYEVVLKVTDEPGLEDTITVTITVTDRNEAPSTPVEASDDARRRPQTTHLSSQLRRQACEVCREHGRR